MGGAPGRLERPLRRRRDNAGRFQLPSAPFGGAVGQPALPRLRRRRRRDDAAARIHLDLDRGRQRRRRRRRRRRPADLFGRRRRPDRSCRCGARRRCRRPFAGRPRLRHRRHRLGPPGQRRCAAAGATRSTCANRSLQCARSFVFFLLLATR